ncbi:3-hydroxyacyl-CoA dehydrogenase family protein [Roseiconus nitratireducens]|nr:3-hydroxyacyl-CoA dehydrogenase family protein [Roseiconus nitratireducens]
MGPSEPEWPKGLPPTMLVGAGVVGLAIADDHVSRSIPFCLVDKNAAVLKSASQRWSHLDLSVRDVSIGIDGLSAIVVGDGTGEPPVTMPIVIESIAEIDSAKRDLFRSLHEAFGSEVALCSNTSTLRIAEIAGDEPFARQVCGLHFFMPVPQRPMVEVVVNEHTDSAVIDAAIKHARRLGKRALRVGDGSGFIVNRMLSPYLNQALVLLCRGVTASQLERAAMVYGMPMSPLELIDWISTPTMYHAGRAYMRAFPGRIDPSPLIPAMVKRKRFGRHCGHGLYDYPGGRRSAELAPETNKLIETYRVADDVFTDGDVLRLLTLPMWIEGQNVLQEKVADSLETVDLAMVGGLGFSGHTSWSAFFAELGSQDIEASIDKWQSTYRSLSRA